VIFSHKIAMNNLKEASGMYPQPYRGNKPQNYNYNYSYDDRNFPVLPFLAGLAFSPFLYGGGYGGYYPPTPYPFYGPYGPFPYTPYGPYGFGYGYF
jgi:hypothetical protein